MRRLRCQLLFVDGGDRSLVLDCVAVGPDEPGGSPFAIEVDAPGSPWAPVVKAALARWAAEGAEVELEFRDAEDTPRVQASDGVTRVLLDVRALTGV